MNGSPVSSPWHEHLVERKLSVEVLLDHVHPLGVTGLAVQLLVDTAGGQWNVWIELATVGDFLQWWGKKSFWDVLCCAKNRSLVSECNLSYRRRQHLRARAPFRQARNWIFQHDHDAHRNTPREQEPQECTFSSFVFITMNNKVICVPLCAKPSQTQEQIL